VNATLSSKRRRGEGMEERVKKYTLNCNYLQTTKKWERGGEGVAKKCGNIFKVKYK
jgi:hypothetical protein